LTQKELLYIEDAIGHEQNIEKICENTLKNLTDEKLISFMQNEIEKHKLILEKLLKMLEVKANG